MSTFFKKSSLLALALMVVGTGCGGPSNAQILASQPVTIEIWRVFDDADTFESILANYRAIHPNVSFEYKELRYDEYEDELIRAFAEGEGPDMFSVHNTWIGEYENLILPMPDSLTIPYAETRGTIKKETVYTVQEEPTISQRALKNDFVDVVAKDVIRDYKPSSNAETQSRVFGIPLSVDTLALYYNRDLLNAAGIPEPPGTWSEFQSQVQELTRIGANDEILQAGAAIGTGENIERSFDILSLLMMQNGTQMTDDRGRARFGVESEAGFLSIEATRFYTDFANPLKTVYTWNDQQTDSFDAFTSGEVAFFFGYSYHHDLIETANEKLNFGVTEMPQIDGGKTVNYANYWVETVAKSTEHADWAWDIVQFMTGEDQVTSHLEAAEKPAARRALISGQLEDEKLSIFSNQTLTSESWYRGNNAAVAEEAFIDLMDAFLSGADQERAIKDAQNKVNETI